ncbi:hypothetical protein NE865_06470 [Phthorimaea operculella]|nr:hypothetical protein NE865_06470 [Phthorimaea operculella]
MKCAVAVVLALIGMAMANPVPSLGHYAIASPLLLPSAVSVQSSVVNHGITLPKLVVAPVLHAPLIHAPLLPTYYSYGHGYGLGWGWGKGWH